MVTDEFKIKSWNSPSRVIIIRHFQFKVTNNDPLVQLHDHFKADQKWKEKLLRVLSNHLSNTGKLGASTSSPGRLLQCLTSLSVKKCILMSSLKVPWNRFEPPQHIPSLGTREKSPTPPSLLPLLRNLQRAVRAPSASLTEGKND